MAGQSHMFCYEFQSTLIPKGVWAAPSERNNVVYRLGTLVDKRKCRIACRSELRRNAVMFGWLERQNMSRVHSVSEKLRAALK